ncbi:hypothetical protein C2H92_08375 [Bacillus halotolerans]|nr:hypothetical protein C2H92_08375 [Bacillus halotolerans]
MGALFLHLKPDEYLKKLYKTKKLVEKTSFSLQAEEPDQAPFLIFHSYEIMFIFIYPLNRFEPVVNSNDV